MAHHILYENIKQNGHDTDWNIAGADAAVYDGCCLANNIDEGNDNQI